MQASLPTAEQLKHQLIGCLDEDYNVIDFNGLASCLECIEGAAVTKETLEATRLGLLINDLRKRFHQSHPDLSKKCRNIVKLWQKLLMGSASFSGSTAVDGQISGSASPATGFTGSAPVTPRTVFSKLTCSTYGRVSSTPAISKDRLTPKSSLTNVVSKPVVVNGHHPKFHPDASISPNGISSSKLDLQKLRQSKQCALIDSKTSPPVASSPAPLKIRIKMGGISAESALIVKSSSVPSNLSDKAIAVNGSSLPPVVEEQKPISLTASAGTIPDLHIKPETSSAQLMVTSGATLTPVVKKSRQKRTLDHRLDKSLSDSVDPNDPLSLISRGLPLPRLKTTADLVAEIAGDYPEEMAKSMASAAALPAGLKDEMSFGTPGSPRAKYSKHDDYLDVTKSELVAKYLRSSGPVEPDIAGAEESDRNSPCHDNLTPPELILSAKKRTETGSARRRLGKLEPKASKSQKVIISKVGEGVKGARKIDWYDILPPLDRIAPSSDAAEGVDAEIPTTAEFSATPSIELMDQFDDKEFDLYSAAHKIQPSLHSRILVNFDRKTRIDTASAPSAERGEVKVSDARLKLEPVLALPYVDVGLPAFLEYKYPEAQRHFAHWSEK